MHSRDAIALGRSALQTMSGQTTDPVLRSGFEGAARQLGRILEQKGCEEIDAGVDDGTLTLLMDIIIDG